MRPSGVIETGEVLLGKYVIEELLGRGGMGLVYRAHHIHLDELVAIKVLRSDVQLDEEAVTRFKREAQAAVRLKSEHVARILDVGAFTDGSPFMVMEFLAGADLGSLVDANGPTEVPTAVDLMLQACDALAEAHAAGIVHRDVKPTNLFVSTHPDGTHILKVLDFGISKSATGTDLSLTQTASVLGTPAYMSPEQMRSARRVDARTDIWSLGTVLYELVEGRRPFRAETFSEMCVMAAVDPFDPMTLAPQLEPVIAVCLEKDPKDRFQSIADLAEALAPFARDPNRAIHYVSRTRRMHGRAAVATPVPVRDIPSQPVRMPSTPAPDHEPGTLNEGTVNKKSGVALWVALAVLLLGGVAAAAIYVSTRSTAADTRPEEGNVIKMSTTTPTPLDAAVAITPDASEAIATKSGAESTAAGSAKKPVVAVKRPVTPVVKKGSGAPAKGSAATTQKGSAEPPKPPPPKPKCDVWNNPNCSKRQ